MLHSTSIPGQMPPLTLLIFITHPNAIILIRPLTSPSRTHVSNENSPPPRRHAHIHTNQNSYHSMNNKMHYGPFFMLLRVRPRPREGLIEILNFVSAGSRTHASLIACDSPHTCPAHSLVALLVLASVFLDIVRMTAVRYPPRLSLLSFLNNVHVRIGACDVPVCSRSLDHGI